MKHGFRASFWLLFAACGMCGYPAFAQTKSSGADRDSAKRVSALAEHWWRARPPSRFVDWDPASRAGIEAEARAIGRIPEGACASIVEALWAPAKKLGPKGTFAKGKLTLATPYGEAWCYFAPATKEPGVVIGLHGGGEDAGSADEPRGKWILKNGIGIYPQGIRLVHDTWNTVYGERFVLSLLDIAKVQYDADPNRVYVMGFSMGGTGSWFFAGRHTDYFAGAAPFSGVLMAAPQSQVQTKEEVTEIQPGLVPNVFNLAMHYTIGLEDKNTRPGTYLFVADMLAKLRERYPAGYGKFQFESFPRLAHEFPPGEPAAAFKFLFAEERVTFPREIVWEATRTMSPEPDSNDKVGRLAKPIFYWLGCKEIEERQLVHAVREKNEIQLDIVKRVAGTKGLTIYLRGDMIDAKSDVVVRAGDKEIYRGKPEPDVWTVLETLDEKLDRSMVFDRRIEL